MDEEVRQSVIQELLAEGLSLGEIEQFMEILTMQQKTPGIGTDREFYENMSRVRTPTGRGYGGVYVSADPLEHIGAAGQSLAGHYGRWKAREKQDRILEEVLKRRMGPAGLGARQPATTPVAPPVDPGVIVGGPRR